MYVFCQGKRKRKQAGFYNEGGEEEETDDTSLTTAWRMPVHLSPHGEWGEYHVSNKFLWYV